MIRSTLKLVGLAVCMLFGYLVFAATWAAMHTSKLVEHALPEIEIELTPHQTDILLAVEDPNFYHHFGLDFSKGQGLTTITSSVAKTVYLDHPGLTGLSGFLQSFYRAVFDCCKAIDLGRDVMALVLDLQVSKRDQLQIFLDQVYLGHVNERAIVGIRAAAQHYFSVPLKETSAAEFTQLVAMMLAPNHYRPGKSNTALQERTIRIDRLVNDQCQPVSWLDIEYKEC